MRKLESIIAGSFFSFSLFIWIAVAISLPDPLPPVAPRTCEHGARGCCRHKTTQAVYWPDGPCTPDCFRAENRCPGAGKTPGGNGGGAFRARN